MAGPTDTDTPALAVSQLGYTYPKRRRQPARTALDDVSFTVATGESVALLGPNGSGKSTLMRLVSGLLPSPPGAIAVGGKVGRGARRRRLGVVFQHDALDGHLTVRENLRDQAALYGLTGATAAERVDGDLAAAGLDDRADALVKTLSGGLRRRVDLCRALLHHPSVLLLDEPTTGLDPAARTAFLATLDERRAGHGLAILMSTHLVDEADRQDRVVLLDEGRIVADDTPEVLRRALGARRLTITDDAWEPPTTEAGRWQPGPRGWSRTLDDDAPAAGWESILGGEVTCTIGPPTLADVFETRTGHALVDPEVDA
ncbi:MAG: ABC transporter ATP-binding protein [Planctomycetes bacterium]|nr:ABC transporter ATP-binding protein [Planctomycetota bacterium]